MKRFYHLAPTMNRILFLSSLLVVSGFAQERNTPPNPSHELTRLSINRLEENLSVSFKLPFPVAELDTDARKRQPIALLPLDQGKVSMTRPFADPHDGSIEWMIGTEEIRQLGNISIDVYSDMDESGEFLQVSLTTSPDDWARVGGSSNLSRGENESGKDFMDRAVLTYRLRAKSAANPEQALLFVSGFEKIMRAIHQCRKEQAMEK